MNRTRDFSLTRSSVALHWEGDASYLKVLKFGPTPALSEALYKTRHCGQHVAHPLGIG